MAEGKIALEIVTPSRRVVSAQVDVVTAPGFLGEFGVLPRHTPYLCALGVGALSYRSGSARYFVSIMGGYAEVGPDKVTVLAELAERAEEIDAGRAQEAKKRAEDRMAGKLPTEAFDFPRAELALRRALARLSVYQQSGMGRD